MDLGDDGLRDEGPDGFDVKVESSRVGVEIKGITTVLCRFPLILPP